MELLGVSVARRAARALNVIKALITSEQLTKSLTELLTSQAYLEYLLNQQKNDA